MAISSGTWTLDSGVIGFSADLSAGAYHVKIHTAPNGYIKLTNSIIQVNKPNDISLNTQQFSFNGGKITITGTALSPSSYITVNKFRGNIIDHSSTIATYQLPALVTVLTQNTFNFRKVELLSLKDYGTISDDNDGNVDYAFDEKTDTYYASSNADCYLGVDSGEGLQTAAHRFRFYPRLDWGNVGKKILHA